MIINYPTGLYKTKTDGINSSDNITWYITNNNPPHKEDVFWSVPSLVMKLLPEKVIDKTTRRKSHGSLVFTVENAAQTETGIGFDVFKVGQPLDIEDILNIEEYDLAANPDIINNHRTSIDIGQYVDNAGEIMDAADIKMTELSTEYVNNRSKIFDYENIIKSTNQQINDINRAIAALKVIDSSSQTIIDLESKVEELTTNVNTYISEHDELVILNETLRSNLSDLGGII